MGLFSSPMFVSKNPHFPILLHFFVSVQFLEQFPSGPPVASFFLFFLFQISTPSPVSTNLIHNLKLSLIYELSLAVLFFCSNAVLITIPSSSIHFSSFFDMLPSAPTTTGMTLMLLMFHIFFFSLVPRTSQVFPSLFLFFTNPYVFRYSNISYSTTSLIFIHYNNIWFSCLDLSFTSHKIFTSSFSMTPS